MRGVLDEVTRYLREALGVPVSPAPWPNASHLPFFLRDRYEFCKDNVLGVPCLFMVDRGEHEEPPATIRKHLDQAQGKWDGPVVYVRERVTAYNRKRLIEQRVPFIIPGNQMYLPMLGLDLREHFRSLQVSRTKFRPSTQAVLIHMLLRDDECNPTDLAPQLGYSAMTVSRAMDEIEAAGLAEPLPAGRERRLRLKAPRPDVWQNAKQYLRSPVQGRYWVWSDSRQELPGPLAGLSALAHYSMLAEPHNVVVAVSREDWKALQQRHALTMAMANEPDALNVEVWKYPPTLFSAEGLADRLSLHLSLQNTRDERVEAALDRMMGDLPW